MKKITASELSKNITINVHVKKDLKFSIRNFIGIKIIKIGFMILPFGSQFNDKEK